MDFLRRGSQTNQHLDAPVHVGSEHHGGGKRRDGSAWLRFASVMLLFSGTILVVAVLVSIVIGGPKDEAKYVDHSKLQAVFLNGVTYFGHIQALNSKYMRITGIYYLQVNQQIQPKDKQQASKLELVPLGCEVQRPQNEMLVNRDQIIFWENLKDDSGLNTVPGRIKKYEVDFPNGKPCPTATTSSSSSSQ